MSTVPTPRPPGSRTESPCPDEVNDALPQVPEPQPRRGQLQQLRSSLSLRLSSLDPGWLERCQNGASDLLEVPHAHGLDLSTKESQPQMLGKVNVVDPNIHSEVSSQSPQALTQQSAQVLSWSPKSSNSKDRKRKRNEKGEDFAQAPHSSQAGLLPEGAGATAHGQDLPGEPTQVNAPQPRKSSHQARTEKAKGTTHLHISPRPASLDKGNYIRLNMKTKCFVRVGASRGRLLRKQVRCTEWNRPAFPLFPSTPKWFFHLWTCPRYGSKSGRRNKRRLGKVDPGPQSRTLVSGVGSVVTGHPSVPN